MICQTLTSFAFVALCIYAYATDNSSAALTAIVYLFSDGVSWLSEHFSKERNFEEIKKEQLIGRYVLSYFSGSIFIALMAVREPQDAMSSDGTKYELMTRCEGFYCVPLLSIFGAIALAASGARCTLGAEKIKPSNFMPPLCCAGAVAAAFGIGMLYCAPLPGVRIVAMPFKWMLSKLIDDLQSLNDRWTDEGILCKRIIAGKGGKKTWINLLLLMLFLVDDVFNFFIFYDALDCNGETRYGVLWVPKCSAVKGYGNPIGVDLIAKGIVTIVLAVALQFDVGADNTTVAPDTRSSA
jgi:hypothetical protein